MSKMTNQETEQEKKYREEFEAVFKEWKGGKPWGHYLEPFRDGYLAACKKRQEEIEGWKRVAYLKSNTCDSLKEENDRLKDNALAAMLPLLQNNEDEIQRLKDLVTRAKPWVIERKYAKALDKKNYVEELVWQGDAEKEIGG